MPSVPQPHDTIDRATSRVVCAAVGEKLRQSTPDQSYDLPPHLSRLMDALRRADGEQD